MKALTCPQCGSLIRHILPHQPIADCDYCGAKVVANYRSAAPEPFDVEVAKFRPVERFIAPRPPIQPIFIAISGIGIFMFLMLLISFIPLKTRSAAPDAPAPSKPPTSPPPTRKSVDLEPPTALDSLAIPTVSYCDLTKSAADYNGKTVRLRAIYYTSFEQEYLYDERCQIDQPPSAPPQIPAETWAQWDKSLITKGDSNEAKLNRRLNGFGRKDVTVTGKFDGTNEPQEANAPNRFGHMNCCRFQFSIMRVNSVVELENKAAKIPAADVQSNLTPAPKLDAGGANR